MEMVPVGGARPNPNFAASQPAGEFMGPGRSVNRQFCGKPPEMRTTTF
jgi:hypothetical protein